MNKILVFGDSIAYGKWDKDGGWVQRIRRYIDEKYNLDKGGNVQVYNLGIPGEVVSRMVNRVQIELESRLTSPKDEVRVIFAIGVNDSCPNNWMTGKQTPREEFKSAYLAMIDLAKKRNCKVLALGLAPVNPTKSKGMQFSNEEVIKYDELIGEICRESGVQKIEIFDYLKENRYVDLLVDSVHPNDLGHKMLFEQIIPHLV